jgi:hypothetical protein
VKTQHLKTYEKIVLRLEEEDMIVILIQNESERKGFFGSPVVLFPDLQPLNFNFGFTSGFFRIPLNVGESDLNRALPITSAFRGSKGEKRASLAFTFPSLESTRNRKCTI